MKTIANTMKLRSINKELIKEYLKTIDNSTKNDIAKSTGLSIATCGNVLKELIQSGEVLEIELQASTGGRPARRFKYNGDYGHIALLYPRKEGTRYTIFWRVTNLLGCVQEEVLFEVKEMTLKELDTTISLIFDKYHSIQALSLGLPGVVKDGSLFLCDFDRISHMDMSSHIKKKYDVEVIVENDMNATAYGYFNRNQYTDRDNLAYIYFPVDHPSGAGIIINNKVMRGFSNFAGELSFLPIGSSREEQKTIQYDQQAFATHISKMIQSINCVINPKTIILSGYRISDPLIGMIESDLRNLPSAMHQPQIIFEEDIHESYIDGLLAMALDQLKYEVALVTRP